MPRTEMHAFRRVITRKELRARYRISEVTLWRWERDGKLPPRDVYIAGKAEHWYEDTILNAERGPQEAA